MNSTYTFSPDDAMNPVYCRECRVHIPDDISVQGKGVCPDCIATKHQAQFARQAKATPSSSQQASVPVSIPDSPSPVRAPGSIVLTIALLCVALLGYHFCIVTPLEHRLTVAQNQLADAQQKLNTAQKQILLVQGKVEHTENHVDSLTDTVNHNAEVANYNARLGR